MATITAGIQPNSGLTGAPASSLGVGASSGAPEIISSREMRASPMSRNRCFGSFCKQRCNKHAYAERRPRGSCDQSGSRIEHRRQHIRHCLATECHLAGQHLVEHAAEGPDVRAAVDRLAFGPAPGDMYAAVPRMKPACVAMRVRVGELAMSFSTASPSTALARPKSRIFTESSRETLTFAGFRSRCTMPRSCAYSRPSAICFAIRTASSTGNGPDSMRSASVGPSTSSITSA